MRQHPGALTVYKELSAMTIYNLYVKTHNKTGLKYLGQTTKKDPHKYPGSGKYWTAHLNKHGYDYTTEVLHECQSKEELKEQGLHYSNIWNVVESAEWANLKPESGDGGDMSMCKSFIEGIKNRKMPSRKGIPRTKETCANISKAKKGKMPKNLDLFTQSSTDTIWYHNPITGEHSRIKQGNIAPRGFIKGNIRGSKSNTDNPRNPTPVRCVELSMDFPTLKSAAQFANLKCPRDIVDSIIGRNQRKTAGGYHWQFLSKD
jgi:hypothetical protein